MSFRYLALKITLLVFAGALILMVTCVWMPMLVDHRQAQIDQVKNQVDLSGEIERLEYHTAGHYLTVIRWKDGRTSLFNCHMENPVPSGVRARVLWEGGEPKIVPVLAEKQ